MEKLNVLITDKSIFYKKIIGQAVESTGLALVTQSAPDVVLAHEKLNLYKTDVLILDMPSVDAKITEALEVINKDHPHLFVIIMIPEKGIETDSFLRDGLAIDFIIKPPVDLAEKRVENLKKQLQGIFTQIITIQYTTRGSGRAARVPAPKTLPPDGAVKKITKKKLPDIIDLVLIASSTGGPKALDTIFKNLPAGFNKPILVVQHMPAELTKKMAQSLDKKSPLTVLEAEDGSQINPGIALVAPGGKHLTVQPGNSAGIMVKLTDSPPVNGVKPSADVLFESVAKTCRGKTILAIILTGMGSDGMLGVSEIKKNCDCYCITQSESTCVVYGMPRSVVNAGLSDAVEDLESIPAKLRMYSRSQ